MNIQRIKLLTWLAALGLGGYLGWEVWSFLQSKAELEKYVDRDVIMRVLDEGVVEPEPPADHRVDPDRIVHIFHEMKWTGKKEIVPEVVRPKDVQVESPIVPVSDLLRVLAVMESSNPEDSSAYVRFVDKELKARHAGKLSVRLGVGDRLEGPKYKNIRVESITVDGVEFAFDDPERESEIVPSLAFESEGHGIVVVEPGGAIMPTPVKRISTPADFVPFRPRDTYQRRPNEYQIGSDTVAQINDDYSLILSRDLNYRVARNPNDGSVAGIQVTKVAPNSLPAKHGLTEGEIVKSINGHTVRSVNDAVAFVKKEASTTSTWVVVFEKQGREFTRTYESPVE